MESANAAKSVLPPILLMCFANTTYSRQIAFPGVEEYGKFTMKDAMAKFTKSQP